MKLHTSFLALVLLGGVWACGNSAFSGMGAATGGRDKGKSGKGGDANDVDTASGGEEGEGGVDGGEDSGLSDGGAGGDEQIAASSLDGDGFIKSECLEKPRALPSSLSGLKEVYTWHASGSSAAANQVLSSPMVAKLKSSDKYPTIIVSTFSRANEWHGGGHLYFIDGKTGEQKWASATAFASPTATPAVADIDGKSGNEVVVVGQDFKLYALNADGSEKWVSPEVVWPLAGTLRAVWGGPAVADLDDDGKVEIITPKAVLAGKTGEVKFSLSGANTGLGVLNLESVIVAPLSSSGQLGIILSGGVRKASDGSTVCDFATPITGLAAARLREDDESATVIGISPGHGKVFGYDAKTCAGKFTAALSGGSTGSSGSGGSINIADFDGDGVLDFGVAGYDGYFAFKADGSQMWKAATKDYTSAITASTTFDLNGDGASEVIYNDEDKLYVFDGKSGKVLYRSANSSITWTEYPVIADVDDDGHADLVVAANDSYPEHVTPVAHGVRVYRDPDNAWVGTRNIWNQYGYYIGNVRENGKVIDLDETGIFKPWLKKPYLAGFRNNLPMLPVKAECLKP